ncbi:MAG: hypothetical protein IPM29_07295 [Planctomycetes bacterium]|nr:hypothetical protein [Planctomycetota bacterium]
MSPLARLAIGVVLLLGGFGAWWFLFGKPSTQVVRGPDVAATKAWQSSQQCKDCHQAVWEEWYGSHHQIAYLNREVRLQSEDFRQKECQACHLPQPVSVTGFGQRTLARQTRPNEGVGCITCHLGANGEVLSRNTRPELPCRPVRNEQFLSMDQCQSCHNQHYTTDQWRASQFAAQGTTCNDCHMPEVERHLASGEIVTGRAHVFPGAHDIASLRAAGRFDVGVEGGELVLALENVGAGHNFPTEERHRAVDMMYRFVPASGEPGDWQLAFRFRQPYRDEPGENTQLPSGERHEERIAVPADVVAVQARLWYRLMPIFDDADPRSTLLFEREVQIP